VSSFFGKTVDGELAPEEARGIARRFRFGILCEHTLRMAVLVLMVLPLQF
jgi:hypothetical protein